MSPARRVRANVILGIGGALTLATLTCAYLDGVVLNASASMPRGLWRVSDVPPSSDGPHPGETVAVCPPDTAIFKMAMARGYIGVGNCPGRYEPLIKPIAAAAGDIVAVAADGVSVNGVAVPDTARLDVDSGGRALASVLPDGAYVVAPGEVWLLSGHNIRSFDSRYFGPVPVAGVRGIAHPVLVEP